MSFKKRRFVFTEFNTLQHVSFEKLEKVCDRLFVLIHQQEKHIPLPLVLSMQGMGKDAKWVVVPTKVNEPLDYHLCFLLGKLDEKLPEEIEFAILSGKDNLDPLIDYINLRGRNCLRVTMEEAEKKGTFAEGETEDYVIEVVGEEDYEDEGDLKIDLSEASAGNFPYEATIKTAEKTKTAVAATGIDVKANETVERLKYTGNRPAEVVLLRDYISLFHQGIEEGDGQADQIINKLVEDKLIEVRKGIIKYNF